MLLVQEKAVHNAKITASDFVNGSAVISSDNVEIKWLKEINANIGRGNSSAPVKPFPDVIYKGGSLDIEAEIKYSKLGLILMYQKMYNREYIREQ